MKTSLFLKSAAVLLTALALGVFLFTRVRVDAEASAPSYDLLITNAAIVDGISYVIVNGAPVLENDQMTLARPVSLFAARVINRETTLLTQEEICATLK